MATGLRPRPAMASRSDLETRATGHDHDRLRVWLRLLSCTNLIEARVRQSLQARFSMTLPRFDLMAQLERAPDGLQMSELSRRMMVTGGNVTAITDQLENENLVERAADPQDRRALRVRLTRDGRRVFARMALEHERWITDVFGALSEQETRVLARLLARLKSHLTQS